jgi:GntR family transcriptional regulator
MSLGTAAAPPASSAASANSPHLGDSPSAGARRRADVARDVADVLRQQILLGRYAGHTLPPEGVLASEFRTSRNSVREALDLLRCEGIVERTPGLGTTVRGRKFPHGLDLLLGLGETLDGHGAVTNLVRSAEWVTAPPAIARELRLDDHARLVRLERLRSVDGRVLSLDLTYLVPDIGEAVLAEDLASNDVFVLIERITGRPLSTAQIAIEAVNADPRSAALLGVPEGAALLLMERLAHLDDGRPVDLEYVRFRGDRMRMSGQLFRPTEPAAALGGDACPQSGSEF